MSEMNQESAPTLAGTMQDTTFESDLARRELYDRLLARENAMADGLRMIGMNFGLYPEIVAEALASVGMGTPLSTEERAMIHSQFHQLMVRLQQGNN